MVNPQWRHHLGAWIERSETAVELRPKGAQKRLNADADTAAAMHGIIALADVVCCSQHLPRRPPKISRAGSSRNEWRVCQLPANSGIDPRVSSGSTAEVARRWAGVHLSNYPRWTFSSRR